MDGGEAVRAHQRPQGRTADALAGKHEITDLGHEFLQETPHAACLSGWDPGG